MPRQTIKKLMPHPRHITENWLIKKLGPRLQDPGIWHINRRSVSGAVALGLFCTFIPFPFQMVLAALGAILFRVNILISVPMVWITNPVTITPVFYFCYLLGSWLLNTPPSEFEFQLTFDWLRNEMVRFWQPLLLGCLVVASTSALAGFLFIRLIWRYHIIQHIKERKLRKKPTSSDDV